VEWRIRYWHGWECIREQIMPTASAEEITAMLQRLCSQHTERASSAEPLKHEHTEVRSNLDGTMFWTTGKDHHYTAERVSRFIHGKPLGRRD
jgi:hypothetical protein